MGKKTTFLPFPKKKSSPPPHKEVKSQCYFPNLGWKFPQIRLKYSPNVKILNFLL